MRSARRIRCLATVSGFALTLILAAMPAAGQSRYEFEAGFERDVNRYRWIGRIGVADTYAGWRFLADNRFLSDAFLLFDDRLSFRDENHLAIVAERPLSPLLTVRVLGRSGLFSQSRVYSQDLYAGLRYRPAGHAWVEARAGAAWDSRPGAAPTTGLAPLHSDAGPAYGAAFAFEPPTLQGYRLRLQGESAFQVIEPRRGRMLRLNGAAERQFEQTEIQVLFDLSSYRRDAYQAVSFLNRDAEDRLSETIEATRSDTLSAVIRVNTPLPNNLRLGADIRLDGMNRTVAAHNVPVDALFFDTAFRRRAVEAQTTLAYETRSAEAHLAFTTGA
ncbi:MAG TPA: hypothetical protein VF190_14855, partial [Rhodothermales bacterium]